MNPAEISAEILSTERKLSDLRKKLQEEEQYWKYPQIGTLTFLLDKPDAKKPGITFGSSPGSYHGIDPKTIHIGQYSSTHPGGRGFVFERLDGKPVMNSTGTAANPGFSFDSLRMLAGRWVWVDNAADVEKYSI